MISVCSSYSPYPVFVCPYSPLIHLYTYRYVQYDYSANACGILCI